MQEFLNKYKVLIVGLLMAVALPLQEIIVHGAASTQVLVFAAFTAALSYVARNFRGQWATIAGLLGTTLATYITMQTAGAVSWSQLVLQFVISILAALTPPAKSRGYENTPEIKLAKQEGEVAVPTSAEPKP